MCQMPHESFLATTHQPPLLLTGKNSNRLKWYAMAGMLTHALLVSGPSRTAYIEQTLTYGVHGPKELIVLIIE